MSVIILLILNILYHLNFIRILKYGIFKSSFKRWGAEDIKPCGGEIFCPRQDSYQMAKFEGEVMNLDYSDLKVMFSSVNFQPCTSHISKSHGVLMAEIASCSLKSISSSYCSYTVFPSFSCS